MPIRKPMFGHRREADDRRHPEAGSDSHTHHRHGQGRRHSRRSGGFGHAFAVGIALNLTYVAGEAVYGVLASSLALLADASHNLGDVLGLGTAWAAAILAQRRPTARYTYGLRSTTILAALGNAIMLLVVTGGIAWEAIQRFTNPEPVAGMTVLAVAATGIAINGITALMFMSGRKDDLNIRSAFTHMASDALIAFGVAMTGGLILWTGWPWLDSVVGLLVSAVIVVGTWSLLRDALGLALNAVPGGIDAASVARYLAQLPGVIEVHDLHIWGMSTTDVALTAHLVRPGSAPDDGFLAGVGHQLHDRFGIGHATLQIESGDRRHPCRLAPSEVI